jgi:hypothetical protein
MNCHDAREGISRGGMGLTERALVHAHLMQCVECQKERASLPLLVSSRQRVAPSCAARLTQLRVLMLASLTVPGQATARVIGSARVGVPRVVDLLTRVGGRLSVFAKRFERAATNVIGATRFGITRFAHLGNWLRVSLMIAFRRAARVAIESTRVGVTRVLDRVSRVCGRLSVFAKRFERAAANVIGATRFGITHFAHLGNSLRVSLMTAFQLAARVVIERTGVGVTRVLDRVSRVRGLLAVLVKRFERAAANVIGATRFGITRFAHLGNWLRLSLMVAFQRAARVAIESTRVGVTRLLDLVGRVRGLLAVLVKRSERVAVKVIGTASFGITHFAHRLTRVRVLLSISLTVSVQAAGRVIAARLGEAMRLLDLLPRVRRLLPLLFRRSGQGAVRAVGATRGVGRIVVATAGGALALLEARMSLTFGARPLLKVCTGIVSLAVLMAAILALWPRQWPDNLMARFSAGERLSRDVRRPVDRNPAELAAAAPLVKTSAPKPVSAAEPAPVEVSPPETPRVATRRKSPDTQTEIPAPWRRSASAPLPTEAARNAEASDSTAAIDWLLQGGSSRRRIENP